MATDNEIKVLLTADTAQLQSGMDAGAASVSESVAAMQASIAEEAAAFNAAVQAKIDAQVRINAAFAGGIDSTASITEAEIALDEAMSAGAITAKEYAARTAELDAAELSMAGSTDVATVAIEENTAAQEVNAVSSRTSYELGVLLSEGMSGNFGRMKRSAAALGNSTGVMNSLFTGSGPIILGVAGAVLAFGAAAVKGAEEQTKMAGALAMTGGAAGITASDFQAMAESVGDASGSFGNARDALMAIVSSGKFAADQIRLVGTAAQDMARLTGESIDQSVAAFIKLQDKPVQASVALNNQYHYLTAAIFEQIEALQQEGNTQDAARVATEAYASALAQRSADIESHLGTLARGWDSVKSSASWAWDAMMNVGKEETVSDKIERLQAKLVVESQSSLGQPARAKFNVKAGHVGWESTGAGEAFGQDPIKDQIKELHKLMALQTQNQGEAKKKATDDATQKQTIQDIAAQDKFNSSLKDTSHLQDAITEAKKRAESIHKNDPGSASVKGITFDASGAVAGGEQWAAEVAKLTKQYGEHLTPAIHVSGKAASNAAHLAMNALDMERLGTAQNTDSRIQADAKILASATQMYGAYSNEQKYALSRMLSDEKSYDNSVVSTNKAMLAKIEADKKKHDAQIKKSDDKAKADMLASWQKALKPIDSAFQKSINGMIQGTQTFKKGLDNILSSIVASYAQLGVQTLMHWIATEGAKTTATTVGTAARGATEAAGAVQSKALDAATGKSQITSAAATGAAKAYQAIVGIPYVGPVLAPIAAGVAFAGIEAFAGSISSARGGWERVPFDGAMTELHKDEMVLPAHIANPMRQMAQNGGNGGGGQNVTINTTDPRGFRDMLRRNPGALADAMKYANRRGHFAR